MDAKEGRDLLLVLQTRFNQNPHRHPGLEWETVRTRLASQPTALLALHKMESTGGEPDVVQWNAETGRGTFIDCSAESPIERRSLCYDAQALDARKENKPLGSAVQMALDMGIRLLTEDDYRTLQQLGQFDSKTSSWIETPPEARKLGGALFCDRRYTKVFTYHNGAQSYYAARGFRGALQV